MCSLDSLRLFIDNDSVHEIKTTKLCDVFSPMGASHNTLVKGFILSQKERRAKLYEDAEITALNCESFLKKT